MPLPFVSCTTLSVEDVLLPRLVIPPRSEEAFEWYGTEMEDSWQGCRAREKKVPRPLSSRVGFTHSSAQSSLATGKAREGPFEGEGYQIGVLKERANSVASQPHPPRLP